MRCGISNTNGKSASHLDETLKTIEVNSGVRSQRRDTGYKRDKRGQREQEGSFESSVLILN